jgi:nitrite reductase/ring-hydroxylating ferredoxin subunit
MVAVTVGDTEVLLARVQGQYYAISNVCNHADAPRWPGERGLLLHDRAGQLCAGACRSMLAV